MGRRPRILIIDDLYGDARNGRNRDRENLCLRSGIADVSGDVVSENLKTPVADAVFWSGQRLVVDRVENDLAGTLTTIRQGFSTSPRWSLVLLDLHFKTGAQRSDGPEGRDEDRNPRYYFGLEILRAIQNGKELLDLPVIILSSMDRAEVEAAFSGLSALDFCDKSILDRDKLQNLLLEHGLIEDDTTLGSSIPLLKCLREGRRRARYGNDNILVVGESGTGKELIANYIHRSSGRSGAYVPLFTQGVPDSLIEDRLFGHEKGAYSGAGTLAAGAAEQADMGTLFIDEFGDIPLAVQAKLLRLLDVNTREVQRLGAARPMKLDLQVVMATSRLESLRSDDFRSDLLYRAKADDAIELPPLRERREDIPILVEHFLRRYEERFGAETRTVPPETMETLIQQEWLGNVRDLERVVERAVLDFKGLRILSPQHLKFKKPRPSAPTLIQGDRHGTPDPLLAAPIGKGGTEPANLRLLLKSLVAHTDGKISTADLIGSYGVVRDAMHRSFAGLLRQALIATSKPTTEKPKGEIYYTPAVHLLLGIKEQDKVKWKTPKCADLVRQIIGASEDLKREFLEDEALRAAYEAANRLRGGKKMFTNENPELPSSAAPKE